MCSSSVKKNCKYVVWKNLKRFTNNLKMVYAAVNKDVTSITLDDFEER
jgi:hypothetical protein